MKISYSITGLEINGTHVTKEVKRQKGYGFGARWEYAGTRYRVNGKSFSKLRAVREYLTQPQHAEIKILSVGEATKPELNPTIKAEMIKLGLIK